MNIDIRNLQQFPVDPPMIEGAVQAAADILEAPLHNLSIVLVDDVRIAALNHQLLHRQGPTDVIAFEAEQDEEGLGGEIIISVQTAACQADDRDHSLARELCLLAVHGLLHVLGHKDSPNEARTEMERLQYEIVKQVCPSS